MTKADTPPPVLPTHAISVRQPWARLIAQGFKDFENRTRNFANPGTYWLHAGQGMTQREYHDCDELAKLLHIKLPWTGALERGGIVGWFTIGPFHHHPKADSRWIFGSGYPITAAGAVPFTPCKGALGLFKPSVTPTLAAA